MIDSLRKGIKLPESFADYEQLHLDPEYSRLITHCSDCGRGFSSAIVTTKGGWRETQISGYCEECFDALFSNGEIE